MVLLTYSTTKPQEVAQMFDVVDVIFDFSGYISGFSVSPDSRCEREAQSGILQSSPLKLACIFLPISDLAEALKVLS